LTGNECGKEEEEGKEETHGCGSREELRVYIYVHILENIWHSHKFTKHYVYICECW